MESSFSQNRDFLYLENKRVRKISIFIFVGNSFYGRIIIEINAVPRTVQSGFVPHVTFLVQKLLGEMEKSGKEKTPG
jgi:hypothetical protein